VTESIDDIALDWVARIDRGPLTTQEEEALSAWQAADVRHRGAFVRAQAIWHSLGRLRALRSPSTEALSTAAPLPHAVPRRRIVATAAAAACTSLFSRRASSRERVWRNHIGAPLNVEVYGRRFVLDRDSLLMGQEDECSPQVRLLQGQVISDQVDATQAVLPMFVDHFRIQTATASYMVNRTETGVDMIVISGRLRVDNGHAGWTLSRGDRLQDRNGIIFTEKAFSSAEMMRMSAWSRDTLELRNEALVDAVSTLNLYNKQKIIVHSKVLQMQKLVGIFRLSDSSGFVRDICATLNCNYTESPTRLDIF